MTIILTDSRNPCIYCHCLDHDRHAWNITNDRNVKMSVTSYQPIGRDMHTLANVNRTSVWHYLSIYSGYYTDLQITKQTYKCQELKYYFN